MAYRTIDENRVPSGVVFFGPTAADQTFESDSTFIFDNASNTLFVDNLNIAGTLTGGTVSASKTVGTYNTTTNITHDVALATAGAGGITLTLPPVGAGKTVTVKKVDSAEGFVTIDASGVSETVDGATGGKTLYYQYESMDFVSDNSNWYVV